MAKLRSITVAALLACIVAVLAIQVSATPENANLVRQALLSGQHWSSLLEATSKRDLLSALDEKDYCVPGKTCIGLTAQLFFGSSCEWSQTAGFVQLFPDLFVELNGCKSTVYPPLSANQVYDNQTLMFTRYLYNDVRCTGFVIQSESYKTATCVGAGKQPTSILWSDAKRALPLPSPTPVAADLTAPKLEMFDASCDDSDSAPANLKCDRRFPIVHRQQSSHVESPSCDQPSKASYLFGQGAPNKCYLLDLNIWYSVDTTANTYTITKTAGCDLQNTLYVKKGLTTCNWSRQATYATSSVRLGSTQ